MSKNFPLNVIQYGNKLLVRSIENGKRRQYELSYKPYLFVKSKKADAEYRTVFGDPADKIQFDSIKSAKEFIKQYEGIENFEFFGMTNFVYPFINDKFPGEIHYDRELVNIASFDIETMSDDGFPDVDTANREITAITLSNGKDYVFLSVKEYRPHIPNVKVIRCRDEAELLARFINEWCEMDPDIITGWNIESFDIPYIINRIRRVLGQAHAERLSPWGRVREKEEVNSLGKKYKTYDIAGVAVMDYMLVYKKWTFTTRESYSLDHIANVELGVGKTDYSEYGSLHGLYEKNFQLYAEYNIRDTEIVNQLEDKLKLLELVLALSYDSKLNFTDAYTSVRMWDVIIHNYLMERNIVIPQYKYDGAEFAFEGGYVKEPMLGRHEWIVSFDLNSLYPHLIMQYNISPEMYWGKIGLGETDIGKMIDTVYNENTEQNKDLLKFLKEKNLTVTPNGCLWKRDSQGFLGAIMEKLYADRSRYKKMMLAEQQKYQDTNDRESLKQSIRYDKIQHAKKIQLNCAYGSLGNQYFRWFNPAYAESVTLGGQLSIRWIEKNINQFLNKKLKTTGIDYVVASDTDSVYLRLDSVVKAGFKEIPDKEQVVHYLDKICAKLLEPFIDESYQRLADNVNAFAQKMKMKRESIADVGIWRKKKMYILNVYNSEGVQYAEPKLKIMGIEAVRSSTPMVCREKIKEGLSIIMKGTNDELIEFVKKFREEFYTLPYEKVAFPRSLSEMTKWGNSNGWKPGVPIHVRGAFVFNRLIDKRNLSREIPKLQDGDKIKFCYLRTPNPSMENVISVSGDLPKEFLDVARYIDYDTQFEKAFESPLKSITDVIGWKLTKIATLEALFGD